MKVRLTRGVVAGGQPRQAGTVADMSPLDAFICVCECNAGEFVNPSDRAEAVEAQRAENRRLTAMTSHYKTPDMGRGWHPLNA